MAPAIKSEAASNIAAEVLAAANERYNTIMALMRNKQSVEGDQIDLKNMA